MSNRIELGELETFLYASADILRGHVEASDYKSFVFPLLFFKRICDVYDEETTNAIKEYGVDGAKFMGNTIHKFVIPEGHHWRDVRNRTENIGIAIFCTLCYNKCRMCIFFVAFNRFPVTHSKSSVTC